MKRLPFYALAAFTTLVSVPALADGPSFAVVNIQQIMNDSTVAKSVHEQLESKYKTFQSDISKREDQLQKEKQSIDKQQSVLSKSAFEEKARTFSNKVTEMQKEAKSKKALLDNASGRSFSEIQKAVTDIIVDLSKEKGFSMALPTQEILFADPKLDITSEVLTRLDKKLPRLDVKFDESDSGKSSKE